MEIAGRDRATVSFILQKELFNILMDGRKSFFVLMARKF
jgi:hypothetical protein